MTTEYQFKKMAISTILGFILTVAIGWLFYRNQIFVYKNPAFQFIVFGFVCPLLISAAKLNRTRVYGYVSAIVTFLIPVTTNFNQKLMMKLVVRDLVYGVLLVFSIFVAFRLYRSFPVFTRKLNELTLWTFAIVTSYLMSSILLYLLFGSSHIIQYLLYQLQYASMIGIGASIGIISASTIKIEDSGKA